MRCFLYQKVFQALVILLVLNLFSGCNRQQDSSKKLNNQSASGTFAISYVGKEKCAECHQREYNLWIGSDHDLAMQEVNDSTVLGNFDNAKFTHFGITSTFFKRNGEFYVNTEGPDGQIRDYKISYVFGIWPLQQYLIEFPGGHFQVLPLCWDTRPAAQGGRRWFHIYPDERIDKDDELYWTSQNQNWNYMCAECHSTNVKKNYDLKTRTYHTTWSEIDVACESCHGPGSRHVEWAESGRKASNYREMGLHIQLKDPNNGTWVFAGEAGMSEGKAGTAGRTVPLGSRAQIEMCARCHARRTQLTDDYQFDLPIMDTHQIQLLSEGYYFPDGQILEEVYVYGSFLQSKMYRQGVICSDCHEPHSGKIYAQGNALCYRCHLHQDFGTKAHHFHHPDSSGASCVECHMPERNYMVIDPRRDHSIRNPRPDLSLSIESPNACNKCHQDKTVQWAAEYTAKWYGDSTQQQLHFGEVFYAARHDQPGGREGLYKIAVDTSLASIVRATALAMLNNFPSPELVQVLPQALQHEDALIRFGALQALEAVRPADRFTLGKHLLYDPLLTIRVQAASTLSPVTLNALSSSERNLLRKSIKEYVDVQLFNADRANSYLNLGNLYRTQGYLDQAEAAYKTAIDLEPYNQFAYINLADLYRAQNRDREGEELLRQALETYPDSPALRHALGLVLVRQKNTDAAIKQIEKAVNLRPDNPDLNYVYAIALNSVGKGNQAIAVLENIVRERPANRNILHALSTLHHEQGNLDNAVNYARQLVAYWPGEHAYRQLLGQLLSEQEGKSAGNTN